MKKLSSFIIALVMSYTIAGTAFAVEGNTSIQSFNKAKKILIKKIYRAHQTTFYCGCTYSQGKVITDQNRYVPKNERWRRAHRLEWEHVVPGPCLWSELHGVA
jgi:deoxyribonuclease-1